MKSEPDNTKISFTVPIYMNITKTKIALMGMNWLRNAHYMQSNKIKRKYHTIISEFNLKPLKSPIHVHYDIYLKRRGSDGMNVRAVIEKFTLDGLQSAGVIEDDNFEIIVSDSSNYYLDRENPRAEITIEELKNEN